MSLPDISRSVTIFYKQILYKIKSPFIGYHEKCNDTWNLGSRGISSS